MEPHAGKVLSFMDIYAQLQALREFVAEFQAFNTRSPQFAENAGELEAAIGSAAAVESAAAPLLNLAIDPHCLQCRAKPLRRTQAAKCSALARSYLQYRSSRPCNLTQPTKATTVSSRSGLSVP